MLFSVLAAPPGRRADFIASHRNCETWCTPALCKEFACSSCGFKCDGDLSQRVDAKQTADVQFDRSDDTIAWPEFDGFAGGHARSAPTRNIVTHTDLMTHYWDCCKPSCGWDDGQGDDRIALKAVCDSHGDTRQKGLEATSACDEGARGRGATMCADLSPFLDKATGIWMGYVASQDRGNKADCCDCYELALKAQGGDAGANATIPMIVQVTNHGKVHGLFDLLVPGGGPGEFDGCRVAFPKSATWSVPDQSVYGGLHHSSDCDVAYADTPSAAKACHWMFSGGIFDPKPGYGIKYVGDAKVLGAKHVRCPAALNERSGCEQWP